METVEIITESLKIIMLVQVEQLHHLTHEKAVVHKADLQIQTRVLEKSNVEMEENIPMKNETMELQLLEVVEMINVKLNQNTFVQEALSLTLMFVQYDFLIMLLMQIKTRVRKHVEMDTEQAQKNVMMAITLMEMGEVKLVK